MSFRTIHRNAFFNAIKGGFDVERATEIADAVLKEAVDHAQGKQIGRVFTGSPHRYREGVPLNTSS